MDKIKKAALRDLKKVKSITNIISDIQRTCNLFSKENAVMEVRILKAGNDGTISGYYTNYEKLAKDISYYNGKYNIYFVMNDINKGLLARANNRLITRVSSTTKDEHVIQRSWMLIDIDAKRHSGISSTDSEKNSAAHKLKKVMDFLKDHSFPDPIICDSGNGWHALYKIDLPNNEEIKELIKDFLKTLSIFFDDDKGEVDQTVFNASQLTKLYSTIATKGDSTADRPHRSSYIHKIPGELKLVSMKQIQTIISMFPKAVSKRNTIPSGFNLDNWINSNNLRVEKQVPISDGTKYILEVCPFNPEHGHDSAIILSNNGPIAFTCFHNGCSGNNWHALREMVEPGCYDQKQVQTNPNEKQDNKFQTIDAGTLSSTPIAPIKYVISATLSVGLHLLAGAPKMGKSWLIIWICLQIARGRMVWGQKTAQGSTLYLCLEDSLNRIQTRMNIILHGEEAPSNVHFAIIAKSINDGLLDQVNNWMLLHPDTQLIAIDTLQKVRAHSSSNNMYANDYQDASQLKQLADKHGIAILLVQHLRKMQDDDVFNTVSGTTGLTGCADSTFILKKDTRQSQEATLHATGRDIEDMELLLKFNKSICTWELISTDAVSFKEEKEFNENPLIIAVTRMMTNKQYWNGTALGLLIELDKCTEEDLPPTPSALTRGLNKLKTRLKDNHIKYLCNKKAKGTFITLEYIPPLPPLSPQTLEAKALHGNDSANTISPLSPLFNSFNSKNVDSCDIVMISEKTDNLDPARVSGGSGGNGDNGGNGGNTKEENDDDCVIKAYELELTV